MQTRSDRRTASCRSRLYSRIKRTNANNKTAVQVRGGRPTTAHGSGNLYPTHGLGPVAQYMNLARKEDNFKSLVSYSTPALGRKSYAKKNYPADHKWNQLDFRNGDMNTSIIKTHLGRTVMVQWDETSPRPYSRLNLVQGTLGALAGFPTRVALEGGVLDITKDHHRWVEGELLEKVYEKYDHPPL